MQVEEKVFGHAQKLKKKLKWSMQIHEKLVNTPKMGKMN